MQVRVVMKKSDQKLFALKYISKAQTISRDVVNNVVNERRILAGINYPLCPQLRYAFQVCMSLRVLILLVDMVHTPRHFSGRPPSLPCHELDAGR